MTPLWLKYRRARHLLRVERDVALRERDAQRAKVERKHQIIDAGQAANAELRRRIDELGRMNIDVESDAKAWRARCERLEVALRQAVEAFEHKDRHCDADQCRCRVYAERKDAARVAAAILSETEQPKP